MTCKATISEIFVETARKFANNPFLHAPSETAKIYDLTTTDYTYGEALAIVDGLTALYASIGVTHRRRIGLALENRPEFFLHFLALNSLGASVVPLNCAMQRDELLYQIEHSECALIIAAPQHRAHLSGAVSGSQAAPLVIDPCDLRNLPPLVPAKAGILECSDARDEGNFDPGFRRDERDIAGHASHREAAILYTSGTTGKPKGCMLSNDYFIAIGALYTGLGGCIEFAQGEERIITPLPATHMNALACSFMAAIQTGGCLIQLDLFHPKSWWATVRESRATIMHYLGVMPAMLLNAAETPDEDFSARIKFAFGAGCDPRHHAIFEKRFGIKLIEAWAMTETGAGAWIAASQEPRHVGTRCLGRAPQGLDWRIVDEEGRDAPRGAAGELLVRRGGDNPRQHFFSGYFKDEIATEDAWRGGWFHTGDAVRLDDDGYFHFVDRLKNVIRRSGENIAAIDVESVLMRHDAVAACVVAPVPDEIRGDEVMALVIAADGRKDEESARRIFDFAMENLVYFKAPGYIAFVDAIPMTASEKVQRGAAKEIARARLEAGSCADFRSLKKSRKGQP